MRCFLLYVPPTACAFLFRWLVLGDRVLSRPQRRRDGLFEAMSPLDSRRLKVFLTKVRLDQVRTSIFSFAIGAPKCRHRLTRFASEDGIAPVAEPRHRGRRFVWWRRTGNFPILVFYFSELCPYRSVMLKRGRCSRAFSGLAEHPLVPRLLKPLRLSTLSCVCPVFVFLLWFFFIFFLCAMEMFFFLCILAEGVLHHNLHDHKPPLREISFLPC